MRSYSLPALPLRPLAALTFAAAAVALTGPSASAAYIDTVDAANPIAHYRFSETSGTAAADANLDGVATAYNGTYVGSPTLGNPGPVPPVYSGLEADNTVVTLNGTSQYVNLGSGLNSALNDAFKPGGTGFTFLTWVSTSNTANQTVFNSRSTTNQSNVLFQMNRNATDNGDVAGSLRFYLRNVEFGQLNAVVETAGVPTNGDFAMIGVTYDPSLNAANGGNAVKFYVNGTQVAGTTGGALSGTFDFLSNTQIGAAFNSSGVANGFFSGKIDESSVFTTVLSPTQVSELYAGSVPEPTSLALLTLAAAVPLLRRRK